MVETATVPLQGREAGVPLQGRGLSPQRMVSPAQAINMRQDWTGTVGVASPGEREGGGARCAGYKVDGHAPPPPTPPRTRQAAPARAHPTTNPRLIKYVCLM